MSLTKKNECLPFARINKIIDEFITTKMSTTVLTKNHHKLINSAATYLQEVYDINIPCKRTKPFSDVFKNIVYEIVKPKITGGTFPFGGDHSDDEEDDNEESNIEPSNLFTIGTKLYNVREEFYAIVRFIVSMCLFYIAFHKIYLIMNRTEIMHALEQLSEYHYENETLSILQYAWTIVALPFREDASNKFIEILADYLIKYSQTTLESSSTECGIIQNDNFLAMASNALTRVSPGHMFCMNQVSINEIYKASTDANTMYHGLTSQISSINWITTIACNMLRLSLYTIYKLTHPRQQQQQLRLTDGGKKHKTHKKRNNNNKKRKTHRNNKKHKTNKKRKHK